MSQSHVAAGLFELYKENIENRIYIYIGEYCQGIPYAETELAEPTTKQVSD